MNRISLVLVFATFLLTGCTHRLSPYYHAQIRAPRTHDCKVFWIYSQPEAKHVIQDILEYPEKTDFMGQCAFSTRLVFDEEEARQECMAAGGDYIIVFDRGYSKTQYETKTTRYDREYTMTAERENAYGYRTSTTTYNYTVPEYKTETRRYDYYTYEYLVYRDSHSKY